MTEEQAEKIILKEHDKDLLKTGYYIFISRIGASDCFENVLEYLDSLNLLKTKEASNEELQTLIELLKNKF